MSAAVQSPMTAPEADRFAEGWRAGRLAARFVLRTMEGETDRLADRGVLAAAIQRIEGIEVPHCAVALPRAERLEAAIRSALALAGATFAEEAVTVLRDALK